MALKWFNVRSKETLVADTEPKIAALFNSSDHGKNAQVGQDFGWRLAPEVVVQMRRILADPQRMLEIAQRYNRMPDEVSESDVLTYISSLTQESDAPVATEADYSDEYAAEIRRLEQLQWEREHPESVTTTTTVIPVEALTVAELEAELAARKRLAEAHDKQTTTTTTTEKPKRNQSASNSQ